MPDEPRRGGTGPRGEQTPQDDQPTGRRRRSLETGGGLSVSDLVERHSRTNIPRPVPPAQPEPGTGRRAAPTPPPAAEPTGRRAAPPPAAPPADPGRRPAPPREAGPHPVPGSAQRPPAPPRPDETGRRAARPRPTPPASGEPYPPEPGPRRQAPDATGTRPRPPAPGEPTGRRARPEEPAGEPTGRRARPDSPPHTGRPEETGRRARRALPDEEPPRRSAPEATGNRQPRPVPPSDAARRLAGEPSQRQPRPVPPGEDAARRPRRLAPGEDGPEHDLPAAEGGPRRQAPEATGNRTPRPIPGEPDGPRRLAPEPTGARHPRPVPGEPTGARTPRPIPGEPEGPRRLAPEATGNRTPRPIPGEPDGPRRLAPEATGARTPRPIPGEPEGPRRLAPEATGARTPRPVPGDAGAPEGTGTRQPRPVPPPGPPAGEPALGARPGPEPREQIDPMSLTTEMEAISEDVKKRREVDHTLARFSAVHDELAEQERLRKERRQKLMPWKAEHDEDATEYAAPVEDDDPDDPDTPRRRGRTPKHSKIVRIIKGLSLSASAIVFIATGLGWGAMLYVDSKFTEIDALGANSQAVHQAEKQLGDENFLIVGSDTRAGAKPQDGVGDAQNTQGARSDVLMLAHIPADRKRVVIVSVPRDLRVTRPACEQWDPNTNTYTGTMLEPAEGVLANQSYADGGPKCVSKFMTELTGLTINHFISVDFNGFKGMVDAVGKVEVCVPHVMDDGELGMIFDKPGKYQLDGQKALDYVRARYVKTEPNGDFDRIKRQQMFLSALLREALSKEMLLNPSKLNAFLNAFAASTVGQNIGVEDMLMLGQSLQGLEAGRVSFVTVPHYTDEGPTLDTGDNLEMLQEEDARKLFQAIIDGTPLPGETPDAGSTPPATEQKAAPTKQEGKVVDPKTIKIQVINGDRANNATPTRTANNLKNLGFTVVNASRGSSDKTVIKYATGNEDAAATLKAAVPGAQLEVDESMGGAVAFVIGPDWDEVIQQPQQGQQGADPGENALPSNLPVVNGNADPCA
ncbi:LCP family protein [Saccharothrix coeruleofusca]|uniref:LytR family transcriptional attenuator n=1 Tax=Saccharothrix coeruleofusca TaxID=33919 RepID=A0A918EEH6_9PSEU|nr:LCP family protein [Saccharothrix coeruleofusca]GGP56508.1 hypothetical protein GCM10010185_30850 [Saccharothrix coeruleofusca]